MRTLKVCLLLSLFLDSIASATPLTLDGTRVKARPYRNPGDFFAGAYTRDSRFAVRFTITDWAIVSDRSEVYDNGVLVLPTPAMPDHAHEPLCRRTCHSQLRGLAHRRTVFG